MTDPTATNWRDIDDTTATVYRDEFARVESPLLPHARAMWEAARPHSALALAHMWMENQYSTTGHIIKPAHNNPMALRPGPGIVVWHREFNGTNPYLAFNSPVDCVREWRRRITDPTYKADSFPGGAYTSTTTLTQYLSRYAPAGDVHPVTGKDNADIGYEGTVRTVLRRLAIAEGSAPSSPEEVPDMSYTPKIIDRWLHVAQLGYPAVTRYIPNRNGNKPRAIVIHVQEGSNLGSWQHFHAVKASSTVLIGKNGDIWRLVPEQHGPWTNGDVSNPDATVRQMISSWGSDPNAWTLTIENEGYTGNLPYTEQQYQSNLWQIREWRKKYGPLPIIRHGQINSVSRPFCPERPGGPLMSRLARDLAENPVPNPAPAPDTHAPPVEVPGMADLHEFVKKIGHPITIVNYKVQATKATPRYQTAGGNGRIGPDIPAGSTFDVMAEFRSGNTDWYITPYWTRVRAADTKRV